MKNELKPNGKVHPIAALFPMMSEQEIDLLAKNIKTVGLLNPIVLDDDGMLIDGRNREEACKRAKVPPKYVDLNGQDPLSFIFGNNASRRHMTKGQLALLAWKAFLTENKLSNLDDLPRGAVGRVSELAGVSHGKISEALMIFQHAPDQIELVIDGLPFDRALEEAKKQQAESKTTEKQMEQLREEAIDLFDLVAEERMKLSEALAAFRKRKEDDRRERQRCSELLRDVVQILDHRGTETKVHAKAFVDNFDPQFSTEEITKERLKECLAVLNEIVKSWKESSYALEKRN
jgi:ParB-like nuclease domain